MVQCKYCDEEFDSEEEMYLHWDEEHSDEINSHDEDKVKKAKREKEEEKAARMQWRKKMMIRGVGGLVLVAVLYVSAPAIASLFSTGSSVDFSELNLENQPMLGEEDANVTIVEFGDFMCGACRSFNQDTKPSFMEHIENGDAKMYYIDFPLPNFRPDNIQAATAAECVYRQDNDQYWEFHDALFAQQGQLDYSNSGLIDFADQNTEGINSTELDACMQSEDALNSVQDDRGLGQNNGVSATPTVFVDGDMITQRGNLDSIIEESINE